MSQSDNIPPVMQERFNAIIALIQPVCKQHLNDEYFDLCRKLCAALCRKRPSPLLGGKVETWACGIVYAIGFVNFLFDKSNEPYMSAENLCKSFNISKSAGGTASKKIRDMFKMHQFDHRWCLPSLIDNNPTIWFIQVDGFIVDARQMPRHIQELAYNKGLIPYIPEVKPTE